MEGNALLLLHSSRSLVCLLLEGFLWERSKAYRLRLSEDLKRQAEHPNGAYLLIKLFVLDWHHVFIGNPRVWRLLYLCLYLSVYTIRAVVFDKLMTKLKASLPKLEDYHGACSALVRLQRVYRLRVDDMYVGNYSGYQGPALHPDDAYEIGRQAFMDGFLQESRDWLQLAVRELEDQDGGDRGNNHFLLTRRGQAYGLLGRTYYFMNDSETAQEIYDIGSLLAESQPADLVQLQRELGEGEGEGRYWSRETPWDSNLTDLCAWDKHHTVERLKPHHVCRCKKSLSFNPFVCYKEEILSISPFVSLFYDVISDSEIEALTGFVKGTMARGLVGKGQNASTAYFRTSDLGWIYDDDMVTAHTLAQRVKRMTGLEVNQYHPATPSSEAFQIVNYGLGGHYDVHMDPFDSCAVEEEEEAAEEYGQRLATFLIYLSDVEKGGNTVFVRSQISVAPRKGMALFWYNFDPKMEKDFNTYHAGCPVLIGQKWIANKWIWTQGNEFRRPCGPSPQSTQRDIEPLMCRAGRHCY
ncbi:hypothetical protein ACOMHN_020604 [Nucella lapillus]